MEKITEKKEKKLFVDDIRNAPDDTWTVARTVSDAIRAITVFDYDIISLDHDISHQLAMGGVSRPYPCVEDFSAVCCLIGIKYQFAPIENRKVPKIILHTSNQVGAFKMQGILKEFFIEAEIKESGVPANRLEMEI